MILICEPQCKGFEHGDFNSALLSTIRYAYKNENILFISEEEHLRYIESRISRSLIDSIDLKSYPLPNLTKSKFSKLINQFKYYKKVFNMAKGTNSKIIIFSSITKNGLFLIKFFLWIHKDIKCLVIPHAILASISDKPDNKIIKRLSSFRNILLRFNNNRLRYLVLGKSIEEELKKKEPKLKKYIVSTDMPYFFNDDIYKSSLNEKNVSFGFLGVAHAEKGGKLLFKLPEDINKCNNHINSKFVLIGQIIDENLKKIDNKYLMIPSPDTPLIRKDYEKYISEIDYAVFLYDYNTYALRASAALFDAFSSIKPVIALRNPFFEYYFDLLGDIGYLCEDYEELKEVISDILINIPNERYRRQCENISMGRKRLSLDNIAIELHRIISGF